MIVMSAVLPADAVTSNLIPDWYHSGEDEIHDHQCYDETHRVTNPHLVQDYLVPWREAQSLWHLAFMTTGNKQLFGVLKIGEINHRRITGAVQAPVRTRKS